MGDLTRNQKKVRETLSQYDLLLCLGADLLRMSPYSPIEPLPDRIAGRARDRARLGTGQELSDRARDTRRREGDAARAAAGAESAGARPRRRSGAAQPPRARCVERNWSAQREGARQAAAAAAAADPIAPRFLMMNLVDALPPDAIVVEEALDGGVVPGGPAADERRQQFLRTGQRRPGLRHAGRDRHQPRAARAPGGRRHRRRQRDVRHTGAVDGGASEAARSPT